MLTAQLLEKFARRGELIKQLKKSHDVLRAAILDGLNAGEEIPNDSMITIQLSPNGGKELDWKEEYHALLSRKLKKDRGISLSMAEKIAKADMEKMYEDAENKPSVKIAGVDYVGGVKVGYRANSNYDVKLRKARMAREVSA